jgi:hypothetical protein
MDYFKVRNFNERQHYKDRNPPWIKLYNSLLSDYEYQQLPDASRSHLIAIWLLASRNNNKLPYDQKWVEKNIFSTSKVDLKLLERLEFIEKIQSCSNMLADRKQGAIPERETEREESRVETDPPIPPKGLSVADQDNLFDTIFWINYPKKVAKGHAQKMFRKHVRTQELFDRAIKALMEQKQSYQWQREGGQYIPNPGTWLNEKRWGDDLSTIQPVSKGGLIDDGRFDAYVDAVEEKRNASQ